MVLIDGDIISYRCAASCEPTKERQELLDLDTAIQRADELVYRILDTCGASEYRVFLSGSENFRKLLSPSYKANRVQEKPRYLDSVHDFLFKEWNAEVSAGCEADDRIGIAAKDDFIIASIDKDFKQIPGRHYNFVKDVHFEVTEQDAVRFFYGQMLIGDRSDNVSGVPGIGEVKAGRALQGLSPEEMDSCVRDFYRRSFGDLDQFFCNHLLLRIVRSEEELREIEAAISEGKRPEITTVLGSEDTSLLPEFD